MLEDNSTQSRSNLDSIGFRYKTTSGAHTARTIMLEELKTLLFSRPESATHEDYRSDVEDFNLLQKPTENSRKYTFKPLSTLYALSPDVFLFQVFRSWWELDESAQDLLAFQLAIARDPYLYNSASMICILRPGAAFVKSDLEEHMAAAYPEKFSKNTLESLVRNLSSSWSQAGYLSNSSKKSREAPQISYVNVAFALFLAHCHGLSGQRLFDSFWCQLLSDDKEELYDLAHRASMRGLLKFKQASEVVEVTFPTIEMPGNE
ncbi:hypothetical protein VIRA109638_04435 [Vibrio rarus]